MQVKDDFTKMSAAQFEELRKKNVELAEAQEARRVAEAASVKMASEVAASSPLSLTIRKARLHCACRLAQHGSIR